jgi:hypothetical protein
VDFEGKDKKLSEADASICVQNESELIDLRPYMIEQPETCLKLDFLPSIVHRFRNLNLRHMIVNNSKNGTIEGIITR